MTDRMAIPKTKRGQRRTHSNDGGRRLYQKLARTLTAAIRSGAYKAGERLPGERELAAEHDVSRPTVREAIIALEVQGLVEVRTGSGAYVKRQAEAAALAATPLADAEIDELDALLRRIERETGTNGVKEQAGHDFHMLVTTETLDAAALTIKSLWWLKIRRSGDPAEARAAMRAHLNAALDHLPLAKL